MMYCGKRISGWMRFMYLVRLWITKTFGDNRTRYENPETGEDDPNGIPFESKRDIAAMEWAYAMHRFMSNETTGYDRDFVNDRIWYELATLEEQDARAKFEAAVHTCMLRGM